MKFAWRTGAVALGLSLGLGGVAEAAESGFYVGVALGVPDQDIGASDGLLFSSPFGIAPLEPVEIDTDDDSFGWGVGILFADQKLTLDELFDPNSMKFGDQVWLAGLGVDYQVAQKWSVRAEYLRSADLNGNVTTGKTNVEMWALGVLYRL